MKPPSMAGKRGLMIGIGVLILAVLALSATSMGVFAQGGVDDREPNDNRSSAVPIEDGEIGGQLNHTYNNDSLRNGVATDEDVDFYSFDMDAGQAFNIYFRQDSYATRHMTIYGPDGSVIQNVSTAGIPDTFSVGSVATESGEYYIRIMNTGSGPTRALGDRSEYGFALETVSPGSSEPNDAIDEATPIAADGEVYGTITKGDADFFAVEAEAGTDLAATVDLIRYVEPGGYYLDNPGNLAIDIFNEEGTRLNEVREENEYPTNSTRKDGVFLEPLATQNTTVPETGTYYVRVREVSESLRGNVTDIGGFLNYSLNVSTGDTANDRAPSTETATPTPEPENGANPGGPTDTLRITGTGPVQEYTFSAANVEPGTDANIDDGTDVIDGDTVRGTVGEGGTDTYRFSGSIGEFGADAPGRLTITVNGQAVDLADLPTREATATPVVTTSVTPTPTATATATPTSTATPTATTTATTPATTATSGSTSTPSVVPTITRYTTPTSAGSPSSTSVESGTEEPTASPSETAATATTTTDDGSVGEIDTDTTSGGTTEGTGPGMGLLAAFVALLTTAMLVARSQ